LAIFDDNFDLATVRNDALRRRLEFLRANGIGLRQLVTELDDLFDYMMKSGRMSNRALVDLGSWQGATAWILSEFVQPGGKIILVDHAQAPQTVKPAEFVAAQLRKDYDVTYLKTTTRQALLQVHELVGDELDHLHIDASHEYEDAKWDYEQFGPLVQPGGLIQLHDIKLTGGRGNYKFEVWRLWDEIASWRHTHTIVDETFELPQPTEGGHVGIGLVMVGMDES
jgi:predicted O-methyltransferase YrrM